MDIWLQWARGPMFRAALIFMVLGLVRHVLLTVWEVRRVIRRAGDKTIPSRQILSATLKWLFPVGGLRERWPFSLTTLAFHISIILAPLLLAGHIALWQQSLGISWPALPNGVATVLTITALVTALLLVIERLACRDTRALSRLQDYVLPLVIALPFATGLLAMHPAWNPIPFQAMMLAHVVSANVLLILIPITKLSHMVLLPTAQLVSELAWHFPPDAGSKVAATLQKESEPI